METNKLPMFMYVYTYSMWAVPFVMIIIFFNIYLVHVTKVWSLVSPSCCFFLNSAYEII